MVPFSGQPTLEWVHLGLDSYEIRLVEAIQNQTEIGVTTLLGEMQPSMVFCW